MRRSGEGGERVSVQSEQFCLKRSFESKMLDAWIEEVAEWSSYVNRSAYDGWLWWNQI